LLRKPEAQRVATQRHVVEQGSKQDACAVGNQELHDQYLGQQAQRGRPVGLGVAVVSHKRVTFLKAACRRRVGRR
jgi:hypothetical protein